MRFRIACRGGSVSACLIAMAMMARPKLLIADEPTTALDVTMQAQILDLLRDLAREQQTAILFVTHDLAVAASLADRVLVLYAGRIVEMGRIQDVVRNAAHPYSAGLLAARFDLRLRSTAPASHAPARAHAFHKCRERLRLCDTLPDRPARLHGDPPTAGACFRPSWRSRLPSPEQTPFLAKRSALLRNHGRPR